MIKNIRNTEECLGKTIKKPQKSEEEMRKLLRKSIVAKIDIKKGEIFARGKPEEIIKEDLLMEVFSLETRVIYDKENRCPFFIPLRGIKDKG